MGSKSIYNTEGLKYNLCDYNDTFIFVKGDITVTASSVIPVAFKKYAPFTKCITKIDGTTTNVTAYLDLIMSMYSLKQYSSNYFDTTDSSWFYSKDEAIKKFEEIRKLTTVQCEDYNVGCLLDYDYLKNYYRLTAVDLSRQKELDADPKAIQQIEFVGKLNIAGSINTDGAESVFNLTIWEKLKKTRSKSSQGSVTVM